MRLFVDCTLRVLRAGGQSVPAVIGRAGPVAAADKREGDGKTPLGCYPLLAILRRPDRVPADPLQLPWRWLRPDDGWSDTPDDPEYNRPVRHPHGFGAEHLWRSDALYDAIVVLAHNQAPVLAGRGSAIFLHVAAPDFTPTEGCVAVPRAFLLALLPALRPGSVLEIAAGH